MLSALEHATASRPKPVGLPTAQNPSRHCRRSKLLATAHALSVFSPSKLNLFLRIVRKRQDGFHDLASLFHVIDLGDTLVFDISEQDTDSLTCNVHDVPTDSSNLVLKALDLFRRHTGVHSPQRHNSLSCRMLHKQLQCAVHAGPTSICAAACTTDAGALLMDGGSLADLTSCAPSSGSGD